MVWHSYPQLYRKPSQVSEHNSENQIETAVDDGRKGPKYWRYSGIHKASGNMIGRRGPTGRTVGPGVGQIEWSLANGDVNLRHKKKIKVIAAV
jgi:hypothetical protein